MLVRLRRLALSATVLLTLAACTAGMPNHQSDHPAPRTSASTADLATSPGRTTTPLTPPSSPARTTTGRTTPAHTTPTAADRSGTRRRPPASPTTPTARSARSTPATSTHTQQRHARSELPLNYPTGNATQLLTVVASSTTATTATLQAWRRDGAGWAHVGPSVPSFVGTAGMTAHPSESRAATPMGSFTLTQAFGRKSDPGTALPYFRTTPADWWISQSGSQYNTHQRCSSCGYGPPDEHLYYETPYYNYAVVIDYNTPNAGRVRQGAGSAIFLHVSVGEPTAGCVSIDSGQLVRIMRWLDPSAHPRVLIGTG